VRPVLTARVSSESMASGIITFPMSFVRSKPI
jgi:hypothetical protein